MPLNILFLCSRNQWRSPTGERVWRKVSGVVARSAGTGRSARQRVSAAEVRWVDFIFAMEEKHKTILKAEFRDEIAFKPVHVLDIPDDYRFVDAELVEMIWEATEPLVTAALAEQ